MFHNDMISTGTKINTLLALGAILCLLPALASSHSPHHLITDIATAAVGPDDSHTYILITDQLFRSIGEKGPWKNLVNGINSRYGFSTIELSPAYARDGTAFVATSGDGLYRSTDYGESWVRSVAGFDSLDINSLSVSSNYESDKRLLAAAATGGAWRSVDGGNQWSMVLSESVAITDFAELPDSSGMSIIAGDDKGNVWRSDDGGRLWEITYELTGSGAITSVAAIADAIFVGTARDDLHRSIDQGMSFQRVLAPGLIGTPLCRRGENASDRHITSVAATSSGAILATSWYGGVYVSDDGGESWSVRKDGLSCDVQADSMAKPHFRDIAVTTFDDRQTIWLGAFDGLFRSDGETAWQQQETLPLNQIKGMAVTAAQDQPLAIGLSTYGGGFYMTEDHGNHWTIGNHGLQTTRLSGLSFSPEFARDGSIYAGASRRLLVSTDRGQSWRRVNLERPGFGDRMANRLNRLGLPAGWLRSDDGNRGPKYPTFVAPLAGDRYGTVLMATRYHGLMSFTTSSGEIDSVWSGTDQVMGALAFAPGSGGRTMFSSVRGLGVIRSVDGGESWQAINDGLDFIADWSANPDRGDFRRDIHIAVSPGFADDNTVFIGSPAVDGLHVSHDGGESWQPASASFGVSPAPVIAIAVAPDFVSSGSLLVSVKGAGLFRSDDRGKNFAPLASNLISENASIEYL
ncbi:MAG: WD40/YVTN/BNR-like repeat-containing protein, partial [Gammaproteobacteria bacterium]